MPEQKIIKCPFCEQAEIKVLIMPATKRLRKGPWGGNKPALITTNEKEEVLTNCPNCGKTANEIKKVLKEGKPVDKSKLIERMKAAGLDPTKFK